MGIVMSDEWLERIERKIDAQTRSQQRLTTVVDSHTAWLESHDRHLEALDKRLDTHDKRFEVLEKQLDSQGMRLDAIDSKLDAHGKQLDAHGTEQHRLGVLVEKLQDDVRGVAEGLIGLGERMDRGFKDVLVRLDERIAPLEAAFRSVAATLAEHERRLPKRPRRRRHD